MAAADVKSRTSGRRTPRPHFRRTVPVKAIRRPSQGGCQDTMPRTVADEVDGVPASKMNFFRLIDGIFWNMGFKTETQANKITPIIPIDVCCES